MSVRPNAESSVRQDEAMAPPARARMVSLCLHILFGSDPWCHARLVGAKVARIPQFSWRRVAPCFEKVMP